MMKVFVTMPHREWPDDTTDIRVYETLEAALQDCNDPSRTYTAYEIAPHPACPECKRPL